MREANIISVRRTPAQVRDLDTLRRLHRGRDFLAARFSGGPRLEDAAAEAGYSAYYFHRLFTDTFGETPHEFLTRLRMERARKLLLAGSHSVTDICFELGFESLGSFSTRFRTLTGHSPAGFRKQARSLFGGWQRAALFYVPACYMFDL